MRKHSEIRRAAKAFVNRWVGEGKERQDDKTFWEDVLEDVFGIPKSNDQFSSTSQQDYGVVFHPANNRNANATS